MPGLVVRRKRVKSRSERCLKRSADRNLTVTLTIYTTVTTVILSKCQIPSRLRNQGPAFPAASSLILRQAAAILCGFSSIVMSSLSAKVFVK